MTLLTSDPNQVETRFCAHCKHLLGVRHYEDTKDKWKCGHENNTESWQLDNVIGRKFRVFKVIDIYKTRNNDCKGNWYELYIQPEHIPNVNEPTIGGKKAIELPTEEIFSATDLQANKEAAARRLEEMRRKKLGI